MTVKTGARNQALDIRCWISTEIIQDHLTNSLGSQCYFLYSCFTALLRMENLSYQLHYTSDEKLLMRSSIKYWHVDEMFCYVFSSSFHSEVLIFKRKEIYLDIRATTDENRGTKSGLIKWYMTIVTSFQKKTSASAGSLFCVIHQESYYFHHSHTRYRSAMRL